MKNCQVLEKLLYTKIFWTKVKIQIKYFFVAKTENEQKEVKPEKVAKKPKKKKIKRKIQSASTAPCETPKKKKKTVVTSALHAIILIIKLAMFFFIVC